jgi:hypothetical protein
MLPSGGSRRVHSRSRRLKFFWPLIAASLCACPPPAVPDGAPSAALIEASPSATPEPSASAAPAALLRGGWAIEVTSASPGVDPSLFDTPEKKAAAFYDHHATVADGKASVAQRTLGKTLVLDARAGRELEDAVLAVDWTKLAGATVHQEGGTVFTFMATIGAEKFAVKVHKLKEHPELKAIAEALQRAAGVP